MNVKLVSITPDAEKTMAYIARGQILQIRIMKNLQDC